MNSNGIPDLIVTLMLVMFALVSRKMEMKTVAAIDIAQQTPQDYSGKDAVCFCRWMHSLLARRDEGLKCTMNDDEHLLLLDSSRFAFAVRRLYTCGRENKSTGRQNLLLSSCPVHTGLRTVYMAMLRWPLISPAALCGLWQTQ